jgi:hypothetical protein
MKHVVLGFTLGALVWGWGGEARAGDPAQVEELIRQGVDLRHAGKDSRALPLFQKAYELERTPRSAGQLGLCELALGYFVAAEGHIGEATASSGNPWVEKFRETLASSLEEAHRNVGAISVTGGPAGATVIVDRQPVGALPLERPLRLIKGPHTLGLQAPGHVAQSRSITVAGADAQTVAVTLEPEAAAVPAAPPPTTETGHPALSPPPIDEGAPAAGPRRTLAWVAAGAAVAAMILGGVETVSWVQNWHKFDDHKDPTGAFKDCGAGAPSYGGAGCAAIHDDLTGARTLALVGWSAGAVLAAGAIILFETSSGPATTTTAAMPCSPDLAGKGLSCRLTF